MKSRIAEIQQQIREINTLKTALETEWRTLSSNCAHENVSINYSADTGHFDPKDNVYYEVHTCSDCSRRLHYERPTTGKLTLISSLPVWNLPCPAIGLV